jgi:hypothetical protein
MHPVLLVFAVIAAFNEPPPASLPGLQVAFPGSSCHNNHAQTTGDSAANTYYDGFNRPIIKNKSVYRQFNYKSNNKGG